MRSATHVTTPRRSPSRLRVAATLAVLPCLGFVSHERTVRKPEIVYMLRLSATDTAAFDVEMQVRNAPDSFRLAWARHPEYDDRFWRFVEDLRAESATSSGATATREPCPQPTCDRSVWRVKAPGGTATLRWRVRVPFERRPRGAWRPFLSPIGALVGGPHSFPYVVGLERAPSRVTLDIPSGWRVATALRRSPSNPMTYTAASADELVESPILVGALREWSFSVRGIPHRIAYWPKPGAQAFDTATFVADFRKLAFQADTLFGGMPYSEYVFMFQDEAYGGLEHPASVTMGVPSDKLAKDPHYELEEAAHEFVHTWNMMAIRPAEYAGVTYEKVRPVPTLWFGEGMTIYYADALPRRAWIRRDGETRVQHLEDLFSTYLANPAYARITPESISRVAYNAGPEALGDYSASVHQVGEVIAFALDMLVRESTAGRRSLDDVMRLLYQQSRGVTHVATRGIGTADVERAVADVCGCKAKPFFDAHVRGATPIDLARWLRVAGMEMAVSSEPMRRDDGTPTPDWRIWAWNPTPDSPLRLRHQTPQSVWGRAGLHTGDVVTAINGTTVRDWPEFRRAVSTLQVGDSVRVDLAGVEGAPARTVRFTMTGLDRLTARVRPREDATQAQRAIGARWVAGW